jgi:hypothetical protein
MCTPRLDLSDEVLNSYAKSYVLGKLTYQQPPSTTTNLLVFHLPGLGFSNFRVFSIFFMLKRPLEPCCNHLFANVPSRQISS